MPSITSLITILRIDFPDYSFEPSDKFRWSPSDKTIYYDRLSNDRASLLHELSHAILEHADYFRDIQLLEMERDAWQFAKEQLGPVYATPVNEEDVEDALDTYREWIHARSKCPKCLATGIQLKKDLYRCLACHSQWKVNDAKLCALRRRLLPQ